jgi:hypothetical protein
MNGGNPKEKLIGHKDPARAIELERSPEWKELSRNHLEGRSAGFFCYGDGGGEQLLDSGRPAILRHPDYFDPEREPFEDMRDSYAPLVWQTRYSGIEVPDTLWRCVEFGRGKPYSENQAEHLIGEPEVLAEFDSWVDAFVAHVGVKGKVEPGAYRAFGYKPPSHFIADIKTKWLGLRMALGIPVPGSSPALQQAQGINRDVSLVYKKAEGTKLRDQ